MIRLSLILGLSIIFIMSFYASKKKAKKLYDDWKSNINNNMVFKQEIIHMINTQQPNYEILPKEIKVYLISLEDGKTKVKTINGDQNQTILDSQYRKICDNLNSDNPIGFHFSMFKLSLYYLYEVEKATLLKLDYPIKLFI